MAMAKREKVLAIIVSVLATAFVAYYILPILLHGNSAGRIERDRLAAEVHKKKNRIEQAEKAMTQIAECERRSLPSDRELAQSLYQNWLTQLVDRLKFRRSRVEPGGGRSNRDFYTSFSFTVRGQATLEELVQFLYAFYTAGHLHQVRHLTLKPLEDSRDLEVLMTIEALLLPGADRRDKLTTETSTRLRNKTLADYQQEIAARRPFSPYRALMAKKKIPPVASFDSSKYDFLTGVTSRDGRPEAWFVARITDQKFQLHEGDTIEIDAVKGKIARIGVRDVEIELEDGTRQLFQLGSSLHDPVEEIKPSVDATKEVADKPKERVGAVPVEVEQPPRDGKSPPSGT